MLSQENTAKTSNVKNDYTLSSLHSVLLRLHVFISITLDVWCGGYVGGVGVSAGGFGRRS